MTPERLPPVSFARGKSRSQIRAVGLESRLFDDLYHFLLDISWARLGLLIVGLYLGANLLFAVGYYLDSGGIENARPGSFSDAFFFSVQTLATIGYGKLVPRSLFANILVTIEAMMGLVGFAMVTGLVFTKFARPTAKVLFSDVAVVAVREGVRSLIFRLANRRGNQIAEAQLHVSLLRDEVTAEGEKMRRFHDLKLTRSQNTVFALTWTVVHPIDESSPLYGQTTESLAAVNAEIIASVVGIDETFSQTVHARWGYSWDKILFGARFADVIQRLPDGRREIDYRRFHETYPIDDLARPLGADRAA